MSSDASMLIYGIGWFSILVAGLAFAVLMGAKDPLNIGDDPPAYIIHHPPQAPERPIYVDLHPEHDALINAQWDAEPGTLRHVLRGIPQN